MFATPDLSALTDDHKEHVYEPAEDTFLLLDGIQADFQHIRKQRPTLMLEIGCGSGVVSTFLARVFSRVHVMCTDINVKATQVAQVLSRNNHVSVSPVTTDLCSGLLPRLRSKVDLLVFNPPYVVTPSTEVACGGIEASWAGGARGREVTDRLLPLIGSLLSASGMFYLVAIKENDIEDIELMLAKQGLVMTEILSRRSGPELLSVLRFEPS